MAVEFTLNSNSFDDDNFDLDFENVNTFGSAERFLNSRSLCLLCDY